MPTATQTREPVTQCLDEEHTRKAEQSYRQILHDHPNDSAALHALGIIAYQSGDHRAAAELIGRAITNDPQKPQFQNSLGLVFEALGEFEQAAAAYQKAVLLKPDYAEAYHNMAILLQTQGRYAAAVEQCRRAVSLNPDYAEAHWNMSLTLLLSGDFIEGWKGYKQRRNADLKTFTDRHCAGKPRWDGSSFVGKRLFVHYEQGLGDNIQFARYLPMIKTRGGTVIFETLRPLMGLLRGFPGVDELVEYCPDKKPSVDFNLYTSLLDAPSLFGTTLQTIPAEVPYLHADPVKVERWRNVLAGPDFKVGIVWAGSSVHGNDRYRSCKLQYFVPLAKINGVRLYGLQKGQAVAQMDELAGAMPITNISKDFDDFTDTAAAIENLDLVISVDTSVLHLAGAMGKPAWALLPFAPEWRWMLSRRDSPWYPTMTLFRQEAWNGWDSVFRQVTKELRIAASNHQTQAAGLRTNCEPRK